MKTAATLYRLLKLKNSFIHLTYADCNFCNTVALQRFHMCHAVQYALKRHTLTATVHLANLLKKVISPCKQ